MTSASMLASKEHPSWVLDELRLSRLCGRVYLALADEETSGGDVYAFVVVMIVFEPSLHP